MANGHLTLGIISHERIAGSMAGPAIRCWEFARALAGDAVVKLFTPAESDLTPDGFELITYNRDDRQGLAAAVRDCDILLAQGFTFNENPALTSTGKLLIIDLYVPMTLEAMGQYEHLVLDEQSGIQQGIIGALGRQLEIGHFFICASERQRDYWLGWLSLAGRVTPKTYEGDRTLRQLIGVAPFGLPASPPVATGKVLKGVHPAIRESDRVLLWGGGIYNWLDPFTPIRAVALLAEKRDDIKLFFMGTRHPDPNVPKMRVYDEAVELSRELGVLDTAVIFNDRWVPYGERVDYLMEADLGVNANIDHVETRFSFRTRILDCIWASLPLVSTHGDSLSEMAERRELGIVVESGNVAAYAGAIERLLDDRELHARCRANLENVAAEFRWSRATAPIKEFLGRVAAGREGAGVMGEGDFAGAQSVSPAIDRLATGFSAGGGGSASGEAASGGAAIAARASTAAAGRKLKRAASRVKKKLS